MDLKRRFIGQNNQRGILHIVSQKRHDLQARASQYSSQSSLRPPPIYKSDCERDAREKNTTELSACETSVHSKDLAMGATTYTVNSWHASPLRKRETHVHHKTLQTNAITITTIDIHPCISRKLVYKHTNRFKISKVCTPPKPKEREFFAVSRGWFSNLTWRCELLSVMKSLTGTTQQRHPGLSGVSNVRIR